MKSYKDINELALSKIESILKKFNVEFDIRNDDIIHLKCPIHDSETMGHSVIYKNTGVWLCFSGCCHEQYGKNLYGFIKALLIKNNMPHYWKNVIDVINDKTHAINPVSITHEEKPLIFKPDSEMIETVIPSQYFINRGYNAEVLKKYEVGDCLRGHFSNRAIVPIRYINNEYMGFSARIHWAKCKKCEYYHSKYETCITSNYEFHFMHKKWYHSKGLQKSRTLYGIHKILPGTKKIALVEGPGCVWKLAEFGIPSVACLGKDFNKERIKLLKSIGVERIMFAPDNDDAGQEFRDRFIDSYYKEFGIFFPKLTGKDISEMLEEDIKKYILGKWEKI